MLLMCQLSAYMSESGIYIILYFNGTPPYQSWYWIPGHPNYIPFESQGIGYYQNLIVGEST